MRIALNNQKVLGEKKYKIIKFEDLTTKTDKVPAEPTPIMKTKIDRENSERSVQEVELNEKDNK